MAAGLDLKSAYDITIPAFGKGLVKRIWQYWYLQDVMVESHLVQD
jgi:hypothetical protein